MEELQKENEELKRVIRKLNEKLQKCKKNQEEDVKLKDVMRKEQERILFYSGCK